MSESDDEPIRVKFNVPPGGTAIRLSGAAGVAFTGFEVVGGGKLFDVSDGAELVFINEMGATASEVAVSISSSQVSIDGAHLVNTDLGFEIRDGALVFAADVEHDQKGQPPTRLRAKRKGKMRKKRGK